MRENMLDQLTKEISSMDLDTKHELVSAVIAKKGDNWDKYLDMISAAGQSTMANLDSAIYTDEVMQGLSSQLVSFKNESVESRLERKIESIVKGADANTLV